MDPVIEEGQEQGWEQDILQPVGDVNVDIMKYFSSQPDEVSSLLKNDVKPSKDQQSTEQV